jgi:thiamine biosynthesis lipoprotein
MLILAAFAGCSLPKTSEPVRFMGEAQGTYYSIIYYDAEQRDFQYEIDSILKAFDQSVSLWVPNSILSRVNNGEHNVVLDTYFLENYELSMKVAANTGGAFDPTVGALVRAWGFGFDATRKVDEHIIDSILSFTGYEGISLLESQLIKEDPRTSIDFNAIAQGYAVDMLGTFLEDHGIDNYLVDIGGEVKGKGKKHDGSYWKVGIEKPAENQMDERDLKVIIELKDQSVATSGNYRKFYEEDGIRYAHTIDPFTGYPVQHSLLSVSVIAESTAMADGLATAFMVMGLEKATQFLADNPGPEAYFIFSDESGEYATYATAGFQNKITRAFE